MKVTCKIFVLCSFFAFIACGKGGKQNNENVVSDTTVISCIDTIDVEKTLKEFYIQWINVRWTTQLSKMPIYEEVDVNSILKKYCTENLYNRITNANLEADPFLSAQDCDTSIIHSLKIYQIKNCLYKVCYDWQLYDDNTKTICTELSVKKENGKCLIDSVELHEYDL